MQVRQFLGQVPVDRVRDVRDRVTLGGIVMFMAMVGS